MILIRKKQTKPISIDSKMLQNNNKDRLQGSSDCQARALLLKLEVEKCARYE